jgi:hypothetical protein
MIYDSVRQGKPSIRNNFGAGRLNTRLSFYFFEINRLSFIQRKSFYNQRLTINAHNKTQNQTLIYLTTLDSTLSQTQIFNK